MEYIIYPGGNLAGWFTILLLYYVAFQEIILAKYYV